MGARPQPKRSTPSPVPSAAISAAKINCQRCKSIWSKPSLASPCTLAIATPACCSASWSISPNIAKPLQPWCASPSALACNAKGQETGTYEEEEEESRAGASTSADAVAHLAFHSWREAAHSAGDRNNSREHAVGHSPGVAGQPNGLQLKVNDQEGGPLSVFLPSAAGGTSREAKPALGAVRLEYTLVGPAKAPQQGSQPPNLFTGGRYAIDVLSAPMPQDRRQQ
jgi:hypothetical protein